MMNSNISKREDLKEKSRVFIREAFRISFLELQFSERIQLLKSRYAEHFSADIIKNEMLLQVLQEDKGAIQKETDETLEATFKKVIEMFELAKIIDNHTKSELLSGLRQDMKSGINIPMSDFFRSLIEKNLQLDERTFRRRKVQNLVELLKQINFGEFKEKMIAEYQFYGSSETGFDLINSDFNISIRTSLGCSEKKLLEFFFVKAEEILNANYSKSQVEIRKAFSEKTIYPLVKVTLQDWSIHIKFGVNQKQEMYKTKLFKLYSEFDPRCRVLGILIKIWARMHYVTNEHQGYLSQESYVILVINFLQTLKDPILPSLQMEATEDKELTVFTKRGSNNQVLEYHMKTTFQKELQDLQEAYAVNDSNIEKLFTEFFEFLYRFKDKETVFSIRDGVQFELDEEEKRNRWVVEDPFDLRRYFGTSLKIDKEETTKFFEKVEITLQNIHKQNFERIFQASSEIRQRKESF